MGQSGHRRRSKEVVRRVNYPGGDRIVNVHIEIPKEYSDVVVRPEDASQVSKTEMKVERSPVDDKGRNSEMQKVIEANSGLQRVRSYGLRFQSWQHWRVRSSEQSVSKKESDHQGRALWPY